MYPDLDQIFLEEIGWKSCQLISLLPAIKWTNLNQEFAELFKPGFGTLKIATAKLYLKQNSTSCFMKARSVPLTIREKVEAELERMVATSIIKPVCFSEWASPIVPILKRNGQVRICGDFKQTVNPVLQIDKYPIPSIDDLYSKVLGGCYFTRLDLSDAYLEVPSDKESQKLTTINTHKGLFMYTWLCLGIASSPRVFQRIIDQLIQEIPRTFSYLDNILISRRTMEKHNRNLHAVFTRLRDAGLRLKGDKCEIRKSSISYLGHRIISEGIHPMQEKVNVVIPAKCRDALLKELHESHPGISRMKSLARSHIWWLKMDADIELFVSNCGMCQYSANMPQASALNPWEWPGRFWFKVHMDYAGPIQGKWILVIGDAHSKYIDAYVVSSPSSAVTETLLRRTFATHGSPHVIICDNASSFTSKEFSRFCALNGIKHVRCATYHPSLNGLAEHAV